MNDTVENGSIVSLMDVSKQYVRGRERINVLDGIDLNIQAGEFVAFMGPSGSGKTTLLNLIAGIDQPTSGTITVAGRDIQQMSSKSLARFRSEHIGFVFQFYNLLPFLTAQKNVELPLLLTNLSGSQRKKNAATALQTVDLADRARHKPGELSGGQQQRVAIARAIVSDPQILVCDEPTGDLDRENATEILELLDALHREFSKTVIMVTHDPLAAERAERILTLNKGQFAGA